MKRGRHCRKKNPPQLHCASCGTTNIKKHHDVKRRRHCRKTNPTQLHCASQKDISTRFGSVEIFVNNMVRNRSPTELHFVEQRVATQENKKGVKDFAKSVSDDIFLNNMRRNRNSAAGSACTAGKPKGCKAVVFASHAGTPDHASRVQR